MPRMNDRQKSTVTPDVTRLVCSLTVRNYRVVAIHTTSTSVLNISLFFSTDTDLINLISFLWFLFSHTVSTLYTGIKQVPSSRGLLGSIKKYTVVFVCITPYANSEFKRTYNCTQSTIIAYRTPTVRIRDN
ncbi:hypothetical protein T02_14782 [Trichinella nativa]|uniref:Uncharacterized protein n=1 Tax=Trichinella nativa TaxID=6335 RepID=A0A0V1L2A4_9BILA|nr:hypothetical protein T02_14782 [Trichinella nativa]